jgi:hypothetical protein
MEPVSNSLAGACFAPLLTFRSAITLNTRITATTMLSRVWRPELSHGAATRFRISQPQAREVVCCAQAECGNLTKLPLNRLLEIGGPHMVRSSGPRHSRAEETTRPIKMICPSALIDLDCVKNATLRTNSRLPLHR